MEKVKKWKGYDDGDPIKFSHSKPHGWWELKWWERDEKRKREREDGCWSWVSGDMRLCRDWLTEWEKMSSVKW